MKKFIALLLAATILMGALTTNASAASVSGGFTDIKTSPYAQAIEKLAAASIMRGTGNNKFSPDLPVTRGMAVTVLGRMAGAKEQAADNFTDVDKDSWYAGYVGWAASNGIVVGDGKGHFMPDATISGKDMDVMLERYAKAAGLDYTAMNQSANTLTRGDLAEMVFFVYALSYLPVYSYSMDVAISNEFGDMPGVLTVYPMAEEWSMTWSTPFFPVPVVATGWYSQRFDYAEMEHAGVLDGILNFRDISDIVTDGIQKLYTENDIVPAPAADPASCEHRWYNSACVRCEKQCVHELAKGVCSICGYVCQHNGTHNAETLLCSACGIRGWHSFKNGICECGATTIFEMDALPKKYVDACDQPGTLVEMEYKSRSYAIEAALGDGKQLPLTKKATVYLPYGYDANKQYDILYLMHGGGGDHKEWFTDFWGTKNMLDNAIKLGYCDPMIVVTPTFYSNVEVEGNEPNGNPFRYDWTAHFGPEMMNDLIPAVESKYSTYANGDTSPESLKASRAHRAYAGLSMGSMTSFSSVLAECTDYVGYVGSFSGGPIGSNGEELYKVADEIAAKLKKADNKMYYWFNGNGVLDIAHDPHLNVYPYMLEKLPGMFQDGTNSCWVDYLWGMHTYESWVVDLYNSLQVFFQLDEPGENPELQELAKQGKLH